ncbi:hypothetical protein Tdes44962_MAKER03298 [Teratosphaeria destructans]|uniref:Rhodopsin domain-containing protein n=1 Tax=Teratosphaeria destructans TaxID=418781 RepID=A0A9W7SQP4_9PEZI|nr:hypothetical protein Tdes44962_MAKER03298 [Teratosphaeria destructans]
MPGNLHSPPASVIAAWPKPNYDAKGRTWIVPYAVVLEVITTAMVATRLWLRAVNHAGPLGLDDLLLVPAYLAGTMLTVTCILNVEQYGLNRHIWNVPFHLYENALLCAWLGELSFLVSTCCTKVSVLLFYRRLTQGTISKRWKYAIVGAIVFTVLYGLAFVLSLIFTCSPTASYWKAFSGTYTVDYTCTDTTALNPLSGALSMFSDLYAVLLPMSMLRHFDAPRRQKVALNVIFSLGLLVVAAAAARTYYLSLLGIDYDLTWIGYNEYVWALLELHLGIICASAPALRAFFRRYMGDSARRTTQNTSRSVSSTHWNTQRDSKQSGLGHVSYSQHGRQPSNGQEMEDNKLILQQNVHPALDIVDETVQNTSSPVSAPNSYVIKTPADYEMYNLRNLERNRPPPRAAFLRTPSIPDMEAGMHSGLNGPLSDWNDFSKPKS